MSNKDIHTEHCCLEHGCVYGLDSDSNAIGCTVVSKAKMQSHPCEDCNQNKIYKNESNMSSISTEHTTVCLNYDPDSQYLVIDFNYNTNTSKFFADCYDSRILDSVKKLLERHNPNLISEFQDTNVVSLEDCCIVVECTSNEERRRMVWNAADEIVDLVFEYEAKFNKNTRATTNDN